MNLCRWIVLLFGTLYPAYASYKAVRTKNVKEYVKWMMYWIVFALFTCVETFTDVFIGFWFPFYYEIKIVLVLWLLSPATKGSSFLYRKFVHPMLAKREPEIDEYIARAKEQGYTTILQLGSQGMSFATNMIMQTAIKGGGGIVNHLRKSYSLCDLSKDIDLRADLNRNSMGLPDETVDGIRELQCEMRTRSARQKAAAAGVGGGVAGSHMDLYFPEVDVNIRSQHSIPLSQIRSTDDISCGYGGEVAGEGLVRSGSLNTARVRRPRDEVMGGVGRGRISRRGLTSEDSDEFDVEDADLELPPTLVQLPISTYSNPPYSNPTEQIPFFANTNMSQLNSQLAFINLLQANQAFMNRFIAQGNRVDSLVFGRNSTDVIVDEIVSETCLDEKSGSIENLTKTIPEENQQTENLDKKATENGNHAQLNKTDGGKFEQEVSSKPQMVGETEQHISSDQKPIENIEKLELKPVISNKTEQTSSSEQLTNKNRQEVSSKEEIESKVVEKSLHAEEIVLKKEGIPKDESGKSDTSVDNLVTKSLEDISLENNELKSLAPRKGRYGKKAAPRPPSAYVSNEDQEIENEDFQDAESEIEGNEFLGKAPDLISELGGETKVDKPLMSHKNMDSTVLNVLKSKSNNEELTKRSESPVSPPDTVFKPKEKHSKLSKLLPKTSHSFLNFFSSKEPSRSDAKSLKGSSENVQTSSRNSPARDRDDRDGIVIPLTDDDSSVNDNSEFFETYQDPVKEDGEMISKETREFEIREMSQSPTARKKNL
ncbi:uncharacterized protein LOC111056540 isoform X2 [Nilaparvata lugens]|uniref:uncharacterized protein LOC111056540 isoform X2 n=1 Tax=Nilaparvata lugens TaxID=108931 RepID=UPI00193E57E9|nr:uncharacterized protein LOC111056540 isoform X2 [Nilaparvata lugens]